MVDDASIAQVIRLCNHEFTQGSRIRLMPDIHAGAGCTVGTTMTIADKVVPYLVGVDIGCGMEQIDLAQLHCYKSINALRAEKSLGTLGGGNHFIEVDCDDEGRYYLVVHSGNRHLGLEVANLYQEEGYKQLNGSSTADEQAPIADFKSAGRDKEIQKALKALKEMGLHAEDSFTIIHNYIDTDAKILRKGAISAKAGERLLIPINMRDGSLICIGRGNEDWNCSAPHGAGRLMSRGQAKENFTVSEYKKQMEGIYTTSVGKSNFKAGEG